MANPLLVIESVSDDEPEDKADAKKQAAADDLIAAVEEKDSAAVVEAITALYRLCALEE